MFCMRLVLNPLLNNGMSDQTLTALTVQGDRTRLRFTERRECESRVVPCCRTFVPLS